MKAADLEKLTVLAARFRGKSNNAILIEALLKRSTLAAGNAEAVFRQSLANMDEAIAVREEALRRDVKRLKRELLVWLWGLATGLLVSLNWASVL